MTHNPIVPVPSRCTALYPFEGSRPPEVEVLRRTLRWPVAIGLLLLVGFAAGFGTWALIVPLAGGAVAPGIISPDGSRRTVQHLEGGIIHKLHVRDGDFVIEGQPLLVLASIQPEAVHAQLVKQQRDLRIALSRLVAEAAGDQTFAVSAALSDIDTNAMSTAASHEYLFKVRLAAHLAKKEILGQRVQQLSEQISGFNAQVESTTRQIDLIREEIRGKAKLEAKGYLAKPELLRLQRMQAEIGGRLGQYKASIAQAEQQIGEAKLQVIALDAERESQIATQSDQIRSELSIIEEKLRSSQDILTRTVIRAPVSGTVVNLQFKTESGVVPPGTAIMDIVPADDKLIIDARVSPMDIDIVQAGLEAKIQLSAFSMRSTPRVKGIVRSVSADRIIGKDEAKAYYLARIEVNRNELDDLGAEVKLVPGMPADVIIVTGNRTMVRYLLDPFLNAMWKTFREA